MFFAVLLFQDGLFQSLLNIFQLNWDNENEPRLSMAAQTLALACGDNVDPNLVLDS